MNNKSPKDIAYRWYSLIRHDEGFKKWQEPFTSSGWEYGDSKTVQRCVAPGYCVFISLVHGRTSHYRMDFRVPQSSMFIDPIFILSPEEANVFFDDLVIELKARLSS